MHQETFRLDDSFHRLSTSNDSPVQFDSDDRPLARVLARRMLRGVRQPTDSEAGDADRRRQVEQLSDDLMERMRQLPLRETVLVERRASALLR